MDPITHPFTLRVEDGSKNPHPTEPHKVATLFKQHHDNGGRNVFQGMIPAVKFRDAGPGGRSHIVRQRTQSGVWVNRTLSESEVDRLFFDSEVPMWWGDDADIKRARQGNAGPPFVQSPHIFYPRTRSFPHNVAKSFLRKTFEPIAAAWRWHTSTTPKRKRRAH